MSSPKASKPKASKPSSPKSAGPKAPKILQVPTIVDALPDGLVPVQFYFADLKIDIETPWAFLPTPGRDQYLVLEWNVRGARPTDAPPILLPNPMTAADFPYRVTIPQAFMLNSAVVDIRYRVHNGTPNSPSDDSSDIVTITIDRDAPGSGALLPPAIFPVDPITEAYLNANPQVPMEIPGNYLDRKVGDQILLYFSDMDLLPTGMPTLVSLPLTSANGRIFVDVPNEVFRRFPGALWLFCFYRLRDRAGNVNPQFSQVARVRLQIDILEPIYNRPSFPQSNAHPNKYLTCSTQPPIWFGVEVFIPPSTDIRHGDLVTLRFQGYRQYPDVDPDPSIVETLIHYWDGVADAAGYAFWIRDVERLIRPLKENAGGEASYFVSRAGVDIGRSTSRFVQFDRVVPTSPAPPDPIYCWIDGNGPED
ncbi:hypothetical protein [Pseudomonas poae]|uniref:Uncharacterized protein n=1 Tax=Pseudomonas poae TaxID=200451 RepID=A0A2S9ET29_9PSED|nr:hypothetical protein [Pseudomonas poae]PRA32979.1 hypothetical protein CQZ97_03635 [Pseudomonas poae]PRC18874.1 hypothetical protein CQZ99_13075 [Pseudomonas poae]